MVDAHEGNTTQDTAHWGNPQITEWEWHESENDQGLQHHAGQP